MTETVRFTYTHPVTSPLAQAGAKGQTKELKRADAEHLVALGYGAIEKEPKDHGGTPSTARSSGSTRNGRRDPEPAEQPSA